MKTKIFLATFLAFIFNLLSSQVPQGFNYQAIARDGSGNILPNTPLQAMMYVQSLSTGGTIFWKELHSTITTNSFGLFTLVVGTGTRQTESAVATFNLIDWSVSPKYLKTEIYYSSAWHDLGTSQLMSVPYAMTSGDLAGTVDKLSVKGTTSGLEDALFEVKNKDGQTVFAVYNEGVRIYVSDGAKAVKGGFAVGGFGTDKAESTKYFFVGKDSVRVYLDTNPLTKKLKGGFAVGGYDLTKGVVQDYLDVNSDSVRIYIDSNPATKKLKGGFAVGGYDMTKAPQEEYLRVTRDSTRIYVNENASKSIKGGFAVSGFDGTKGPVKSFTSLSPENYFIGHEGGQKLTSGRFNSAMGYQSARFITTGQSNAFVGYQSGYNNNTGTGNLFLGYQTGFSTTGGCYNSFVGYMSGYSNSTGLNNSFLGSFTGYSNTTGNYNTFAGDSTGFSNTIGDENSFLGNKAGFFNTIGSNNIFLGNLSGYKNINGDSSIFIGNKSGYNNTSGKSNVYIGNRAGYSGITVQRNVYIGYYSGYSNTTGNNNLQIGYGAGKNSSGNDNVYLGNNAGAGYNSEINSSNTIIGSYAGEFVRDGSRNVLIGFGSGRLIQHGNNNVFLGYETGNMYQGSYNVFLGCSAGKSNNGNYNVFLGYNAGYAVSGSNKLIIDNQDRAPTTNALIYGEFDYNTSYQTLIINAKVGIGRTPTTNKLEVNGEASKTIAGSWLANSDARIKTQITDIENAQETIIKLHPVKFKYTDGWKKRNPSIQDKFYYNFVAQEFGVVFPESIQGSGEYLEGQPDEILQLDSYNAQIVAIKALQEVILQNKEQQHQIESYKSQIQSLQEKVDKIETLLAKTLGE